LHWGQSPFGQTNPKSEREGFDGLCSRSGGMVTGSLLRGAEPPLVYASGEGSSSIVRAALEWITNNGVAEAA